MSANSKILFHIFKDVKRVMDSYCLYHKCKFKILSNNLYKSPKKAHTSL